MSLGDVLTLVGIVVAVCAIAIPPWQRDREAQARFRQGIYYRLEGGADLAALTARNLLDLRTGTVVEADQLDQDLRDALIRALRDQGNTMLTALSEDAAQVREQLRQLDDEEVELWNLMMADLNVSLDRDLREPRTLLGTALLVYCTAYIALVVLGAGYDREGAVAWLRAAMVDSSGPGQRISVFATGLLPAAILDQIAETESAG